MQQTVVTNTTMPPGDATVQRRPGSAHATQRARQWMIEQVLVLLEEASAAGETCLQSAGKAAFRRAMEERTGNSASPDLAAQCILEAIVGYILRAYCHDAARVTPALLDEFSQRVLAGLDQGTTETRRLLQLLGRRTVITDQALIRVQCLVENRFGRWLKLHEAQLA